jgi:hypothetical protein
MTPSLHLVTRERHGEQKWARVRGYQFAAETNVAPIAAAELSNAARAMPLGFVEQDGRQTLVAIMGLVPNKNLFVAPDGRWLGLYVPAALRGYPFRLGRAQQPDNFALVVDEGSGLVGDAAVGDGGNRFFDAEGKPDEATQKVLEFLVKTKQSADVLSRAVAALVEHDLLEVWPLKIKDGDQERQIQGVKRIAEAKLAGLSAEALLALRDAGALGVVYAQLISMGNVSVLATLGQAHSKAASAQTKRMEIPANSFVAEEDDDIKIDWDRFLKD